MMNNCLGCGLAYMGKPGLQECVVCIGKPKEKKMKTNIQINTGFKPIFKRKQ